MLTFQSSGYTHADWYGTSSDGSAHFSYAVTYDSIDLTDKMIYADVTQKPGLFSYTDIKDNVSFESTSEGGYPTNTLYFLAQHYNEAMRSTSGMKGYCAVIKNYDGSGYPITVEAYACYRKSDGVVGMYDVARNLFLTNAGTGSFTKGPNVY